MYQSFARAGAMSVPGAGRKKWEEEKMPKCKGCGAEIIWIGTLGGKSIPCDPQPVAYWEKPKAKGKIVTKNGMVLSCEFSGDLNKATGIGYISHWSTCPKANDFKRKRV